MIKYAYEITKTVSYKAIFHTEYEAIVMQKAHDLKIQNRIFTLYHFYQKEKKFTYP